MSVLAMVKLKGDPDALLAAKREFLDPVADPVFREHGHVSQIIARDPEGLVIFNLWESPKGRDLANADPAMQDARHRIVEATGAQAEFAHWPVIEQKETR